MRRPKKLLRLPQKHTDKIIQGVHIVVLRRRRVLGPQEFVLPPRSMNSNHLQPLRCRDRAGPVDAARELLHQIRQRDTVLSIRSQRRGDFVRLDPVGGLARGWRAAGGSAAGFGGSVSW